MGMQVCEMPGHSVSCSQEVKKEQEVEPDYQISTPTPMMAFSNKVLLPEGPTAFPKQLLAEDQCSDT